MKRGLFSSQTTIKYQSLNIVNNAQPIDSRKRLDGFRSRGASNVVGCNVLIHDARSEDRSIPRKIHSIIKSRKDNSVPQVAYFRKSSQRSWRRITQEYDLRNKFYGKLGIRRSHSDSELESLALEHKLISIAQPNGPIDQNKDSLEDSDALRTVCGWTFMMRARSLAMGLEVASVAKQAHFT